MLARCLHFYVTPDHQIIYGRRGTGKTHAFNYLQENVIQEKSLPVYIDMRQIGSTGGIYNDIRIDFSERATRLLIDTFGLIHDQILDFVLQNDDKYDLSVFGPLLDEFKEAISQIQVVGNVETENVQQAGTTDVAKAGISVAPKDISMSLAAEATTTANETRRVKTGGPERHRLHFTTLNNIIRRLKTALGSAEIWILIDEWAEVPHELQPFLGDLLRRTLCPITGITVKIAAIEKRSNFKTSLGNGYIGIETGADFSQSLNLDEFMVFENDPSQANGFFGTLLFNHVNQYLKEVGKELPSVSAFIRETFTQVGALDELVRASEGIPRDAINILVHAAIKANTDKISIPNIRAAARSWYSSDKETPVNANEDAKMLLRWIIDEVIGKRNSRAFLLGSDVQDPTIEYLFDNRLLHLIKKNISSKDRPGERFNVFSIDYGTYVHLINTSDEPAGLFIAVTEGIDEKEIHVDVPVNDYRSIRRAILDISEYRK